MYQNYYETVIENVLDALHETTLPVRVRANDDHSFTLRLFDWHETIRPIDDVIGAHRTRLYALCKTHNERQELQHIIDVLADTLWMVPKEHWGAFQRIANQTLNGCLLA